MSREVNGTTSRRLVFTPVAGHPGGRYALPASMPAGMPVRAAELRPGVYRLTASVDGVDDYELEATADESDVAGHEG